MAKRELDQPQTGEANDSLHSISKKIRNNLLENFANENQFLNSVIDSLEDEYDIEGEEFDVRLQDEDQFITPFNMHDELEEGRFDKHGYFIWNDEAKGKDNWLDNIDWRKTHSSNEKYNSKLNKTVSESALQTEEPIDIVEVYKQILSYMKPKETITQSIKRLGNDTGKLSSIERLRRKKAGILPTNEEVYKLTELVNKILFNNGNMNVYQESYEAIIDIIHASKVTEVDSTQSVFDMFANDIDGNKQKIVDSKEI